MQNDRLPSLDRLAVFDAAARHLSFTKAAAERFLTQSAVSRQIAALEEELGVPLFRRRHRALDLTDDGRRLASAVTAAIAGVRDAVQAIRGPLRREVLTLTTTPGLASLWLIPRLQDFISEHPGVDVRIDATHDVRSLASEGFDLAVRYGRVGALPGTPLFDEVVLPVCGPALLKRGPPLRTPADLRAHTLLKTSLGPHANAGSMSAEWQSWLIAVGAADVEPAALMTFSNYDAAVAAAVAGQGVLLGRRPIIDRLLRKRMLVPAFKDDKAAWASARGYALILSATAARRASAQALHAWLLAQAAQRD